MTSATQRQSGRELSQTDQAALPEPNRLAEAAKNLGSNDFRQLPVKAVRHETAEAISLVFDLPDADHTPLAYRAGQFLTLRIVVDGESHLRCYSISSSPAVDSDLRVTIKRESGGLISNWLNDTISEGDLVEVAGPEGAFVLHSSQREIVAFAGGSGITPVFSIIRTALKTTQRRVRLLFANRDRDSVIFAAAIDDLAQRYTDRFTVEYRFDDEHGPIDLGGMAQFTDSVTDIEFYVCGPGPFMDAVEGALLERGVDSARLHLERFVNPAIPADARGAGEPSQTHTVAIEINHRTTSVDYRGGTTLLQTGRAAGLRPPSLCETGSCGTCIARVTEGSAIMLNNEVLEPDEVAEGWVLTCQGLPVSPSIHIIYE